MAVERQHLRSQGPRLESIPESVSPFPRQAHQDAEWREARPKCTQLRNREHRMKWAKDLIHALGIHALLFWIRVHPSFSVFKESICQYEVCPENRSEGWGPRAQLARSHEGDTGFGGKRPGLEFSHLFPIT